MATVISETSTGFAIGLSVCVRGAFAGDELFAPCGLSDEWLEVTSEFAFRPLALFAFGAFSGGIRFGLPQAARVKAKKPVTNTFFILFFLDKRARLHDIKLIFDKSVFDVLLFFAAENALDIQSRFRQLSCLHVGQNAFRRFVRAIVDGLL
jgi:hypothetical protein